jgi:hypothetical protein
MSRKIVIALVAAVIAFGPAGASARGGSGGGGFHGGGFTAVLAEAAGAAVSAEVAGVAVAGTTWTGLWSVGRRRRFGTRRRLCGLGSRLGWDEPGWGGADPFLSWRQVWTGWVGAWCR